MRSRDVPDAITVELPLQNPIIVTKGNSAPKKKSSSVQKNNTLSSGEISVIYGTENQLLPQG
jgi:hypothetical protein